MIIQIKNILKGALLISSILGLHSCFDEDLFVKSDRCRATAIYVVNPLNSSTSIQGNIQWGDGTDANPDQAVVTLPVGSDLSNVTIQQIVIPSLATVEPHYSTVHNFNGEQSFWVVAEDGSNRRKLVVNISVGEYSNQIKYGELTDYWVEMGQFSDGNYYYGIGEPGQASPWANTNVVAAILNKASCIPSGFPNPSGHVILSTLYNKTAGMTVGSGIATGNLFLGNFRSNSANFLPRENQRKNSDQGIPFIHKPLYVEFEYQYTPGTQVEEWVPGTGSQKWVSNDINQTDSMEMWAVLQKREYDTKNPANTTFKRIGSAGFISCEKTEGWVTARVPFFYGKEAIQASVATHPESYRVAGVNLPWAPLWVYQYTMDASSGVAGPPQLESNSKDKWKYTSQIVTETWGAADDVPTHLSLTFNSSANGWKYTGAGTDPNRNRIGSKLEIRNVKMIY